ncbi:Uncharacterised protein [Collinsella intestinalis]|nr:Uncharacterised protein [Collinsella intestinalis]
MAAPVSPAMRLWLSLVGMPKTLAPTEYTTIEKSAAHRAMRAICVFEPKSTMLEMVEATLALMCVMMKTPRKLKIALMMMAALGGRQRVVTHVAIAFGASVQPLTKMTPSVSKTVMASIGLEKTCAMK